MLLKIYDINTDGNRLRQIVDCLEAGGVIIYPTDTVYAFGCSSKHYKAIEQISAIKNLPSKNDKYTLVCSSLSEASSFLAPLDNAVFRLMKKVLPGPYTFILKANNAVPKLFHNKKKTVGIRIPDAEIVIAIIKELGCPIISSSVINNDDDIIEYTTDPELIDEKYGHLVQMVVDGGLGQNEGSTIVDCTDGIEVIRYGLGEIDQFID